MAARSASHLEVAEGSSATSAPACLIWVGYFWAKYLRSPVGHPLTAGAGLNELGRSAVARSSETVTFGTPGSALSTVPPKLSNSEKTPTSAKSFSTASWVWDLLAAPVKLSS